MLTLIRQVRQRLPQCGIRKIYHLAQQHEPGPALGRDAFFRVARTHQLLVKPAKSYHKTTQSKFWHRQYPDLRKDIQLERPEQLWVADITYIQAATPLYLHLITDAYSKKIMGWCLATDLTTQSSLLALQKALGQRQYPQQPLIHHSDRGLQYVSASYGACLRAAGIVSSTTQDGSPYDNAVAERINGILKYEFGLKGSHLDIATMQKLVDEAIGLYNHVRPHYSLFYLVPEIAHQNPPKTIRTYAKNIGP